MTGEVEIGKLVSQRLEPHPLRSAILSEVHARPFTPIILPARVIHFAFDTSGLLAQADRDNLTELCRANGLTPPMSSEKHFRAPIGQAILRWEQHSEFTTYTWEMPSDHSGPPFSPEAAQLAVSMQLVPQPGPLLVAVDLHLLADTGDLFSRDGLFDQASLAVAENIDGTAVYATDFQPSHSGYVRILIADRGMQSERAGAMVQRVLEKIGRAHV